MDHSPNLQDKMETKSQNLKANIISNGRNIVGHLSAKTAKSAKSAKSAKFLIQRKTAKFLSALLSGLSGYR